MKTYFGRNKINQLKWVLRGGSGPKMFPKNTNILRRFELRVKSVLLPIVWKVDWKWTGLNALTSRYFENTHSFCEKITQYLRRNRNKKCLRFCEKSNPHLMSDMKCLFVHGFLTFDRTVPSQNQLLLNAVFESHLRRALLSNFCMFFALFWKNWTFWIHFSVLRRY